MKIAEIILNECRSEVKMYNELGDIPVPTALKAIKQAQSEAYNEGLIKGKEIGKAEGRKEGISEACDACVEKAYTTYDEVEQGENNYVWLRDYPEVDKESILKVKAELLSKFT